jgi:hypothetical protein
MLIEAFHLRIMLTIHRCEPVLWLGFAFWLLGVGLKVNFSRTTPMWAEVVTLIVEAIGIGFVHQPGNFDLASISFFR